MADVLLAPKDGLTLTLNTAGTNFSAAEELETELRAALFSVGEKGIFHVSFFPSGRMFVRSRHGNPGLRWRGSSVLGVEGSFYALGQKEERVRFYLNNLERKRDLLYKGTLFEKLKKMCGTLVDEEESKDSVPVLVEEAPKVAAPVTPPPLEDMRKEFPNGEDYQMILGLVKTQCTDGYITTHLLRATLSDLATEWSKVSGDSLLGELLKRGMLRTQAKPDGYRIVEEVKNPQPKQEPTEQKPREKVFAEELPVDVLQQVARLVRANKRYDELVARQRLLESELKNFESEKNNRVAELERQQKEELERFLEQQKASVALFIQGLNENQEPMEKELGKIKEELNPEGELVRDRQTYIGVFKK